MDFKSLIKNIIPYYFIDKRRKSRDRCIIEELKNNRKSQNHQQPDTSQSYQCIISVQGLGYTGSGAVLDLLCEFDDFNVVGSVKNPDKSRLDHIGFEFDLIRLAGGLFELEEYVCNSRNLFIGDAIIHQFIKLVQMQSLFKDSAEYRTIVYSFLNELIDIIVDDIKEPTYNPHLSLLSSDYSIYVTKKLSIKEYRNLCRNFLNDVTNYLNPDRNKYIVYDQLFSDFDFNINRNKEYANNLKTIIVYRDPRDVYVMAKTMPIAEIPHSNVADFIKYYKHITSKLANVNNDALIVRFEDLICDYECQVNIILDYLGVERASRMHNRKFEFLDPKLSQKGIGRWKNHSAIQESDFGLIESELSDFCYHN